MSRPPCRWEVHHICCTIPTTLAANVGASSVSSADVIKTGNHADNVSETQAIFPPETREVNVQMVFDMGHNPAAVSALAIRIKEEFAGRNVR
jgi:folylpolyglutamate synthase/dihydropteroate synthase